MIGDLHDLVELVGDDDDRFAGRREAAQDREQTVLLLRRQDRRRLVQDEHGGVAVEHFEDLDDLLLADRETAHPGVEVDGDAVLVEAAGKLAPRRREIDEAEQPHRLAAQDDVLQNGHLLLQHEVLVHHPKPGADRVLRRCPPPLLSVDLDAARLGPDQPEQHVHQGRLAGAVLADNGEDLAGLDLDRHVVDRDLRAEADADAVQCRMHGINRSSVCAVHAITEQQMTFVNQVRQILFLCYSTRKWGTKKPPMRCTGGPRLSAKATSPSSDR